MCSTVTYLQHRYFRQSHSVRFTEVTKTTFQLHRLSYFEKAEIPTKHTRRVHKHTTHPTRGTETVVCGSGHELFAWLSPAERPKLQLARAQNCTVAKIISLVYEVPIPKASIWCGQNRGSRSIFLECIFRKLPNRGRRFILFASNLKMYACRLDVHDNFPPHVSSKQAQRRDRESERKRERERARESERRERERERQRERERETKLAVSCRPQALDVAKVKIHACRLDECVQDNFSRPVSSKQAQRNPVTETLTKRNADLRSLFCDEHDVLTAGQHCFKFEMHACRLEECIHDNFPRHVSSK